MKIRFINELTEVKIGKSKKNLTFYILLLIWFKYFLNIKFNEAFFVSYLI